MLKKVMAGVLLLLILIVAGAFVLFKTKGDALIEKFSAYVEETTGEPLSITGTPSLTFLPSPGLELGRATWGRPDGPIFVSFTNASVKISASALLTGNVRITGLNADELDVAIRITEQPQTAPTAVPSAGQDAIPLPDSSSALSAMTNAAPATEHSASLRSETMQRHMNRMLDLLPDNLEVTKGRLRITQRDGSVIALNNLDLKLRNDRSDRTVSAIASAQSEYSAATPTRTALINIPAKMSGKINLNFSAALKNSHLAIELADASLLPTSGLAFSKPVSLRGKGEYDLNAGTLLLQAWQLDLPGLTANARGTVDSLPAMRADLIHRGAATVELTVTSSPRELMLALGKELNTSAPNALQRANITASAALREGVLTISKLEGMLGNTPVQGKLNVNLARPGLNGDLVVGDLNLDALLPPSTSPSEQNNAPYKGKSLADKASADPTPKAVRTFTALPWPELNLSVRMKSLKIKGLTLSEIHARCEGTQGEYTINPLAMRMFGSPVTASLKATVSPSDFPPTPESHAMLSANISASGLNLEEAGRFFLQKDTISGQGSLNATLSCDSDAPVRTLSGKGSLSAEPLHIKADLLPPNANMRPQTPATGKFEKGLLTFVANQGVITIESASLTAPRLALNGAGNIDLPAQTIDVAGTLQLPGLAVLPVRLAGPLTAPRYSLNAKTTLDAVNKTLQEHGFDAKKELERGLGSLFKKR